MARIRHETFHTRFILLVELKIHNLFISEVDKNSFLHKSTRKLKLVNLTNINLKHTHSDTWSVFITDQNEIRKTAAAVRK